MPSNQIKQYDEAYILSTTPWRETSILCEIFTKEHGRIYCSVKGARSAKSAYRGQLLAFHHLEINWRGKGEVPTISRLEWIGKIGFLDKSALIAGYYLNELILQLLTRQDPHPKLFVIYAATINALYEHNPENEYAFLFIESCLRRFEVLLIREIGYGLRFGETITEQTPVYENEKYIFHITKGVYGENQAPQNLPKTEIIKISGSALLELEAFANPQFLNDMKNSSTINKEILHEQKILLRAIINHILTPKTLNSRKIIAQINNFRN